MIVVETYLISQNFEYVHGDYKRKTYNLLNFHIYINCAVYVAHFLLIPSGYERGVVLTSGIDSGPGPLLDIMNTFGLVDFSS